MGDPLSVRHVMATGDITERVQKAEQAQNQALAEDFSKELTKQEMVRQTRVNEKDENAKIGDDDRKKEREEKEAKERKAKAEAEGEDHVDAIAPGTEHIIDLRV